MHLSLYRKFRPDRFEGIVRQEHVVRILTSQIEKNAVGHAYLFTGPRGTGKTSIARIFARAVNCEHPENGSPCGKCASCRAIAEGSLDISEIDAASNNGVAEMRELREKVQYPPVSGRYKVYIVDEVHMLTDSAFNALLKTLEEPPAHAIFILATTEPQKIPATILSRCMRLDFKLIPEEDLEKHLKSVLDAIGKEYEEEAVAAIARAGAGSDRDMLSIAEACIVYSDKLTYDTVCAVLGAADFGRTADLAEAMLTADMPRAVQCTESILAEGKSAGVLLKDLLDLLGQLTVAKTCRTAERILALPAHLFARVKEIAGKIDGRIILRATEILIRTENELRFVSSPRISLEAAILRVSYPEADRDPEALMARIANLERKLTELAAAPAPQAASPAAKETQEPQEAPRPQTERAAPSAPQEDPADGYEFPTEEPVFEEAYYADEPARPKAQERPLTASVPPMSVVTASEEGSPFAAQPAAAPVSAPVNAPASEDADRIYARFMRELRKTPKSGALFTMCSDLAPSFEGTKFVLSTQSETILTILGRETHRKAMTEVLAGLGVSDYEVRLQKKGTEPRDAVAELKKNFKDYPIEIK